VFNIFISLAGLSGFLAVGLGAFGAHGLKSRLAPEMMMVYETAVQYHFYHTLALLGVGILSLHANDHSALRYGGWAFVCGIVIFSGSLYVLSISGVKWLGAITPVGGLAFLIGWLCLAYTALHR